MARQKKSDDLPQISAVSPTAAIPGGEFQIRGRGLANAEAPVVNFGDISAPIIIGSDSFVIARVPEGASIGELTVGAGNHKSSPWTCDIGLQVADGLHPVGNPAVDQFGNVFCTFSGARGQKTPVAVFKIDLNYSVKPFINDLMNATGMAFDKQGILYVSSRHEGTVYEITPAGAMSVYVEGMGVATGLAFDEEENLYVGDRSGTVFKISRSRQIYVFATLEASIAAYHLAFGPDGYLYVTGPTTSSFDSVTPHFSRRRGGDLLPRPWPSAGNGLRCRGPPVRCRLADGPARRRADRRRTPCRVVPLGAEHCRPRLHAIPVDGGRDDERAVSRGRQPCRTTADLISRASHP